MMTQMMTIGTDLCAKLLYPSPPLELDARLLHKYETKSKSKGTMLDASKYAQPGIYTDN